MEQKTCKNCNQAFTLTEDDLGFYKKLDVPEPTLCPDCRFQRRILWRAERSLYKRTCDLCNKDIISIYSTDKPHKVYCRECYHSDNWNPLDFGRDFDFSRPFFPQFKELQLQVPRQYAWVFQNVNSDYTNGSGFNKNCYLIFVSDHNEDCMYSYAIFDCKNSLDLYNCNECELCYESLTCKKCYQVFYSEDCSNSQNLYFSKNCTNCSDCIGCVNVRNAKYQIFNEQFTKEEYEKRKKEMQLDTKEGLAAVEAKAREFWKQFPVKYIHGMQNVNVVGDYAFNSKNGYRIFDSELLEDCKFIQHGQKDKNCYDAYVLIDNCQNSIELVGAISVNNAKYSCWPWNGFNIEYSDMCENSNNLFGCINLRKHEYCILNKQYTKEEYTALREKIIDHMKKKGEYGEFFPKGISPFAYNEAVVQEYFPLTKEQALEQEYIWKDPEAKGAYELSADVIACEHGGACNDGCTAAFRITPNEKQFYTRNNLPLPSMCHNCRHMKRFRGRNPIKLWHRNCMKCNSDIETTYSPDRKEIVYCENCYQQEVV